MIIGVCGCSMNPMQPLKEPRVSWFRNAAFDKEHYKRHDDGPFCHSIQLVNKDNASDRFALEGKTLCWLLKET